MTNSVDSGNQPRRITISLIASWVLGTIFALGGFMLVFTEPLAGFLMIVLGAILLPPVARLTSEKLNITLSGPLKFVLAVVLVIAIALSVDDPEAGGAAAQTGNGAQAEAGETRTDAASADRPEPMAATAAFGNGMHLVGTDIEPGTYRSSQSGTCYWARLAGFGGPTGPSVHVWTF